MKEELTIPELCGTAYDKYESFKVCITELDSKLLSSIQQLTELDDSRRTQSFELKQLEQRFDTQIQEGLATAKKTAAALVFQKEIQERIIGQSQILQDTVKQVEQLKDLESILKRAREDII